MTEEQSDFLMGMRCISNYLHAHVVKQKKTESDEFFAILKRLDRDLLKKRHIVSASFQNQFPTDISKASLEPFIGGCFYAKSFLVQEASKDSYCKTLVGEGELEMLEERLDAIIDRCLRLKQRGEGGLSQ